MPRRFGTGWLVLSLSLFFAAVLRCEAARDAFWVDEWITAWTIESTWDEVTPRASLGHSSPLYFWLEWMAAQAFGPSPISLRGISLLASLALLTLIGVVVHRTTGRWGPAIAVVALSAVDQQFVFYASEARPYALVQFVAVLQWLIALELIRADAGGGSLRRWGKLAAWAASGLILFLLHYTAGLMSAVTWAGVVILAAIRPAYRPLAIRWSAAALLFLPVLFGLADPLSTLWKSRSNWASFTEVDSFLGSFRYAALAYGIPGGLALASCCWRNRFPGRSPRDSFDALPRYPWLFGGLILAAVWFAALIGQVLGLVSIGHYRYVIAMTGGLPLLAGIALGRCPPGLARLVSTGCLLASLGYFAFSTSNWRAGQWQRPLRYERWDAACQVIASDRSTEAWPVFVFPNLIEDAAIHSNLSPREQGFFLAPASMLLAVQPSSRAIAPADLFRDHPLTAFQQREVASAGGAWLMVRAGWGMSADVPPVLVSELADRLVADLRSNGFAATWRLRAIAESTVYLVRIECPRLRPASVAVLGGEDTHTQGRQRDFDRVPAAVRFDPRGLNDPPIPYVGSAVRRGVAIE